jgi:CDP-glycerol glycerophosphotransferase (TagB/SpsB family)
MDDQGLAVLQRLAERGVPAYWLYDRPGQADMARLPDLGVQSLSRWSFRAQWVYLRSAYVFYTHGLYGYARIPKAKVVVNLWHGMPVKRIGRPDGRQAMAATYTCATSPRFRGILAEAWDLDESRVIVTGLPRNDILLAAAIKDTPTVIHQLLDTESSLTLVWLPTYREAVHGDIRKDGCAGPDSPGGLTGFDSHGFEALLSSWGAVCFMKLHPMAARVDYPKGSEHFRVCTDEEFRETGLGLSQLLACADVLITDISSVWVDYLLLDRPLIFAFGDLELYGNDRGYTLNPIRDWLPGPVVNDYASLALELKAAVQSRDEFAAERQRVRTELHTFCDGASTDRLLDGIGLFNSDLPVEST